MQAWSNPIPSCVGAPGYHARTRGGGRGLSRRSPKPEFEALVRRGMSCPAVGRRMGLHYGVPQAIEALREGASAVLVNLSRAVLLAGARGL